MEAHLGRSLRREEHVHHRDGNKANNAIENLQLISASDHAHLHHPKINRWSRKHDRCVKCGTTERPHNARGLCCNCYVYWRRAGV
ncbi:MAG: HNH endonuclease [Thermomicrobia bacterium]|nr:HNH endonuclease [Thermomicrobia bacterium]